MTTTCMFLGWWGIISFFFNGVFILSNIIEYFLFLISRERRMAPPFTPSKSSSKKWDPTALPSQFGNQQAGVKRQGLHTYALERIQVFHGQVERAVSSGENIEIICQRFADDAKVPAEDIRYYIENHL